jgi:MinD superfamily P-loop ATPase
VSEGLVVVIASGKGGTDKTAVAVDQVVKYTDFVLIVTEPTSFGLNDLKSAVELVRRLNLSFAVAINRDGIGNRDVEEYCRAQKIDIAFKLPDDQRVTETYFYGQVIVDVLDNCRRQFLSVYDYLERVKVRLDETRCVRTHR